ncbi:MAG: hypothetical protein ACRDBG_28220, partial [Waterburya sp.]
VLFYDAKGKRLSTVMMIGWALSSSAIQNLDGSVTVKTENFITPAEAKFFRFVVGVQKPSGSGSFGAWEYKLEYGETCTAWNDNATLSYNQGAIAGVNLIINNEVVPASRVDNQQQTFTDIVGDKPDIDARAGGLVGEFATIEEAEAFGLRQGDFWLSTTNRGLYGKPPNAEGSRFLSLPPGAILGDRVSSSGAAIGTIWTTLSTTSTNLGEGNINFVGTSVRALTINGTDTSSYEVRILKGQDVISYYGPFDGVVNGVIATTAWATASTVIAGTVIEYVGGQDTWSLQARKISGVSNILTTQATLDVELTFYYDRNDLR